MYNIPWKSKTEQGIVFGMMDMKDSLPRGKVWCLEDFCSMGMFQNLFYYLITRAICCTKFYRPDFVARKSPGFFRSSRLVNLTNLVGNCCSSDRRESSSNWLQLPKHEMEPRNPPAKEIWPFTGFLFPGVHLKCLEISTGTWRFSELGESMLLLWLINHPLPHV